MNGLSVHSLLPLWGKNLVVVGMIAFFANCGEQEDRTTIATQVKGRSLMRNFAINAILLI